MCAIRLISSYMRRDTGCVYTTFLNQTTKINHVKITILLFRIILRLDFRSGCGLAKQKKLHHITKNSMDIVHIAKNKCWWDIEGSDMFIPLLVWVNSTKDWSYFNRLQNNCMPNEGMHEEKKLQIIQVSYFVKNCKCERNPAKVDWEEVENDMKLA